MPVQHTATKTIVSGNMYVTSAGAVSGTVYVGKKSAKSSTKKPKTAPACTETKYGTPAAHKSIPWGSDPRFAICQHCGKQLRRDASGAYI